ncbi:tetratricopeptide repeat protein [Phenylobacterium sp.]|uniref:O-linked N-acetylglucosamine transferase, SPINDLY family protein n=1 Tax=Phenylobacterium sp. TaxID=1871053 RepID=UPI00374D5B51
MSEADELARARAFYLAGRYGEGARATAEAVARYPDDYALWNIHGVMLRQLRRPVEALAALERAVVLAPREVGARVNRGSVLLDLGRADAAKAVFAELLADDPANPAHLVNLARALARLGEAAGAQMHIRQALALKPDHAEAWLQLADLAGAGSAEAEAALEEALTAAPDHPKLLEAKALTLRASGQLGQARAFLETLAPRFPDAGWLNFHLGDLLAESDRARALAYLRRAVVLEPESLDHRIALIQSLERTAGPGEGAALDEAFDLCAAALALGGLKPGHTKVLRDVFTRVCAFEAVDALGDFRTVGRAWAEAGLHTALLKQMSRVRTDADRRELLEQHRIWGRSVAARAAQTPLRRSLARDNDGTIRLGFMSSDLRRHPVSFFALPLFDHPDLRFEVYCYSFFRGEEDALQAHIAARASVFRWLPEVSAREAAQIIADDQLDMLIELGGSTVMNKLEVMAWRPAPRQASWLGYPHSAGLEAIDGFICDPISAPADPALLAETPMLLPNTWIAFSEAVFEGHPPIEDGLPQDHAGAVTFGTANATHKYTPEVFRTWARITAAVPGARFAFVRPEAGSTVFRANVLAAFAAEGVSAERVIFHAVRGQHMGFYNMIDISLDAFPLTGGTTTAEALWMGVPVVSLRGPAFYERLSASILTNAGLGDLVSDDLAGFEAAALRLAADRPRRTALRAGLRDQIRQSPLGRTRAFAADFYALIAEAVMR